MADTAIPPQPAARRAIFKVLREIRIAGSLERRKRKNLAAPPI
jgi:hypothetical protein